MKFTFRTLLASALFWAAACNSPSPSKPSDSSDGSQLTAGLNTFDPLPQGFDWSLPDRFPTDSDGNGVREFRYDAAYLNPKSFTVRLDGCPISDPGYTYHWVAKGKDWTGADWRETYQTHGCRFEPAFPGQGDFAVTLTVRSPSGESREYTQKVTVKDLLIVALGDSYASGEGNPDIAANQTWDGNARWANRTCHRSFKASSALVAQQLEEDRRTSVTYISLACSGANISRQTFVQEMNETFKTSGVSQGSGMLGPYIGIVPPRTEDGPWYAEEYLKPQVEQLEHLLQGRRIDALVMSAGGNDMGFGDVLKHCTVTSTCHDPNSWDGRHLEANVRRLSNELPARYMALADSIHSRLNVANVYLTEYPDLSRDANGVTCYEMLHDISNEVGIRFDGIRRSQGEPQWIQANFLSPLNQHMKNAVLEQQQFNRPWQYVGGVEAEFRNHGMCAGGAGWFRTGPESAVLQGPSNNVSETKGTAHPNEEGHQAYARHILDSLRATDPRFAPNRTLGPDFNGDGKTDTGVFTPAGAWLVNLSTSTSATYLARNWSSGAAGSWGEIPLTGDFNGDGKTDTAVFTPANAWLVNLSTGTGFVAQNWTTSTSGTWGGHPLTGDFNGDGKTDTALFTPAGAWLVNLSTGTGFVTHNWSSGAAGSWGEIPLTGDFNGDGKTDTAVFTPANAWLVNLSTGTGFVAQNWSNSGTGSWGGIPLTGDFDGDRKTDTALFTPAGAWLVNLSTGWGFVPQNWSNGAAGSWGELPLVSDFNNDDKSDTGVFTPASAWLVNRSTGTGFVAENWSNGAAGSWSEIPLNAPQHLINKYMLTGHWYP